MRVVLMICASQEFLCLAFQYSPVCFHSGPGLYPHRFQCRISFKMLSSAVRAASSAARVGAGRGVHTISAVTARPIIDSRGNPTVECDIKTSDGHMYRASVPSGASTGSSAASLSVLACAKILSRRAAAQESLKRWRCATAAQLGWAKASAKLSSMSMRSLALLWWAKIPPSRSRSTTSWCRSWMAHRTSGKHAVQPVASHC